MVVFKVVLRWESAYTIRFLASIVILRARVHIMFFWSASRCKCVNLKISELSRKALVSSRPLLLRQATVY